MEDGIEQHMSLFLNMKPKEEKSIIKHYITKLPENSIEILNPSIGETYYITNNSYLENTIFKNKLGEQLYILVKYIKDEKCFIWDYSNNKPIITVKKRPIFISISNGNRIDDGNKLYNVM